MRTGFERLPLHLTAGFAAAALVGLGEGVATLSAAPQDTTAAAAIAPLVTAVLFAWPGVLVGLGGYALERIWRRAAVPLERAFPDAHERTATLGALGIAAFALGALGALGASHFAAVLARLQDEGFAARLSALAWALTAGAWLVLSVAVASLLRRPLHWLVARRRPAALLRWIVPLASVALATGLVVLARADAAPLGVTRAIPYALAVALVLPLLLTSPVGERVARLAGSRVLWLTAAVAFVAGGVGSSAASAVQRVVVQSPGTELVAALFADATDVDGDGRSSLFGELDCAPFDAARGPLARDVAGNGVDEDCDGHDALDSPAGPARADAPSALPPSLVRRYNVVLVVIDAFRADRFRLAPERTLTPALAALARESVVFTEAFSQSPSTRSSFPSFLTGLAPEALTWRRRNGWLQADESAPMLAERMRELGYRNGLVYTHWLRARMPSLRRGYYRVLDARKAQAEKVSPALSGPSTNARAIEFLEEATRGGRPKQPFFLTLYYDGPHSPYVDWTDAGLPPASARPIDRYEGELRYVDRQLGHFLDYLRVKPKLWPDTVVIVTSDHGEEFHEHGGTHHDRTCYRESTHVPLILRIPDAPPAVVDARVALVDLVPTVLQLVGAPAPEATSGRPLVRASAEAYAAMPDARVTCTYFANRKPNQTLVRAVRDGRWLYVRDFARSAHEVYDTVADRAEQHDLGDDAPAHEVRRRLATAVRPPDIADE